MFCTKCGKELSATAKFCTNCGTKVETVAEAKVEEAVPVAAEAAAKEEAAQETVETTPIAEAPKENAEEAVKAEAAEEKVQEQAPEKGKKAKKEKVKKEKVKKEKTKKKSKGKIVALVLVLLILIGGGTTAAVYFTGDEYNSQKNMELAEACFAEGEFEDALDYYEEAIERDETLYDAYLKCAEISAKDNKFSEALEYLYDGMDNVEDEEGLKAIHTSFETITKTGMTLLCDAGDYTGSRKLLDEAKEGISEELYRTEVVNLYIAEATAKKDADDFEGALAVLMNGKAELKDNYLDDIIIKTYAEYSEYYLAKEEFNSALDVLNDGFSMTNNDVLLTKKVDVYKAFAEKKIQENDYDTAMNVLIAGYDDTRDEYFKDEQINLYCLYADKVIKEDSAMAAIQMLRDVNQSLESEVLTKKEESIAAQIQIKTKEVVLNAVESSFTSYYDNGEMKQEFFYDLDGELVLAKSYNEDGLLLEERYPLSNYETKYEYGENGNLLTVATFDLEGNMQLRTEFLYDEIGNLVYKQHLNAESEISGEETFEYDEKNNLLVETIHEYDIDYLTVYEYAYDEKGNVLTYKKFVNNEFVEWTDYEYDTNGYVIVEISRDEDGNQTARATYEYLPGTDFATKIHVYNEKDEQVSFDEYEYDENGNMTKAYFEIQKEDGTGISSITYLYFYNEYGNLIRMETTSDIEEYNETSSYEYEYDEAGNVTSCRNYSDDIYLGRIDCGYDVLGNVVYQIHYDAYDNSTEIYQYAYEYMYIGE